MPGIGTGRAVVAGAWVVRLMPPQRPLCVCGGRRCRLKGSPHTGELEASIGQGRHTTHLLFAGCACPALWPQHLPRLLPLSPFLPSPPRAAALSLLLFCHAVGTDCSAGNMYSPLASLPSPVRPPSLPLTDFFPLAPAAPACPWFPHPQLAPTAARATCTSPCRPPAAPRHPKRHALVSTDGHRLPPGARALA